MGISLSTEYDELEEIKRKKLEEYRRRMEQAAREEEARKAEEAKKQAILRKILTPAARQRLNNLKIAYPELAETVEDQLIALAASGRIRAPITDEMLKKILASLTRTRREIKIRYNFKLR